MSCRLFSCFPPSDNQQQATVVLGGPSTLERCAVLVRRGLLPAHLLLLVVLCQRCCAQDTVYLPRVRVQQETQLDWTFPVLRYDPEVPPADLLPEYDWRRQTYEFFGPRRRTAEPLPLLIFISPQNSSVGWKYWRPVCQRHGIAFAEVQDAGNAESTAKRVRATIEVLGDLRRRQNIDVDRTYLSGWSGGAGIATLIACHLPEYFGGVVCIGNVAMFPPQPWLVDRVRRRISIATLCGDAEAAVALPARLLRQHEFEAASIRSSTQIVPGMGHEIPPPRFLESALLWMEQDLPRRRQLAKEYPASRIADAPSRSEHAARVFRDAEVHLKRGEGAVVALRQLGGIVQRWPGLPITSEAEQLLDSYESREARPWETLWKEEAARLRVARAEGFERLALSKGSRMRGSKRSQYARQALKLWADVTDGDASMLGDVDRLAALRRITENDVPTEAARLIPLTQIRFQLVGKQTRWAAFIAFQETLRRYGYEVLVDDEVIEAKSRWIEVDVDFDLKSVSFGQLVDAVIRPMGVRHRRKQNQIILEMDVL